MKQIMVFAVMVFAFFAATISNVYAESTAQILAKAPTFQIELDASGSSPATDVAFMASAWPVIESKLRAMPFGTRVLVHSFGDASATPISIETRIQGKRSKGGDTMDGIARELRAYILAFPKRVKPQPETHAVGAFFDASKNVNLNATSPNVIIALTDLIENSPYGDCYSDHQCRLPKEKLFSLKGVDLLVLGAGRGLPSDREIALHKSWSKFFDKTGANYELKRTF